MKPQIKIGSPKREKDSHVSTEVNNQTQPGRKGGRRESLRRGRRDGENGRTLGREHGRYTGPGTGAPRTRGWLVSWNWPDQGTWWAVMPGTRAKAERARSPWLHQNFCLHRNSKRRPLTRFKKGVGNVIEVMFWLLCGEQTAGRKPSERGEG